MVMGIEIDFENSIGMRMNMGMTFENGYGYRYNSTRPVPASRLSLITRYKSNLKLLRVTQTRPEPISIRNQYDLTV